MTREKSKIIERIEKLLSLAGNNPSQEEALRAAEQAARLMTEYQIDRAVLEASETEGESVDSAPIEVLGRNMIRWKGALSNGIAVANGCKMYWSRYSRSESVVGTLRQGESQAGKYGGRGLMIVGRVSDIEVVSYLYAYFSREIERLAKVAWKEYDGDGWYENGKTFKNNFRLNAAYAIVKRLREARADAINVVKKARGADCSALVKLDEHDRDITRFYENLGLGSGSASSARYSAAGARAGSQAGSSIAMPSRGVRGVGGTKLLGG